MNVSGDGYYSSKYLNEQIVRRNKLSSPFNAQNNSPNLDHLDIVDHEDNIDPFHQPVMTNVRPRTLMSPPRLSPQKEEYVSDDDQLQEEITPAQLNYLHQQSIRPYQINQRSPYQPKKVKRQNKNDDYYLNQKKRYDNASKLCKPKMYSHKTFLEVFEDKNDESRYNPMDLVFKGKEETEKKNLFNKMQVKFMKDSVDDYSYYDHRMKKSDIFVNDNSDDERKVPLKKMLGRKINRAKKELGRDFDDYATKQRMANNQAKEKKNKREVVNEVVPVTYPSNELKEKISPMWNYLLSYLNYKNDDLPPESQPEPRHVEPEPELNPEIVDAQIAKLPKKRFKRLTKNSKLLFSNWNTPANNAFGRPKILEESINEEDSKEFIIECDDSDMDSNVTEELFYNPETKQLETTPPTSSSSMLEHEVPQTRTMLQKLRLQLNVNTSLAVVSNLMNMIKQIQIMKMIFSPIDIVADHFPHLQTIVIFIELIIFLWILYELSKLVDAICMMVKAFCAPMIAIGRLMNRIM